MGDPLRVGDLQSADDLGWVWQTFKPNPGPQERLLRTKADDRMFGGAKGGGKTAGSLADFINCALRAAILADCDWGAFVGIMIRKTNDSLDEVRREIVRRWCWREINGKKVKIGELVGGADFRLVHPVFRGFSLKLRHCETEDDAEKYQGHNYQWGCLEEGGLYRTPKVADILQGTLRSDNKLITPKFMITANPGGPGHAWLKRRYVTPSEPNQVFVGRNEDGYVVSKRIFIPSLLDQNPHIPKDYERKLRAMTTGDDQQWKALRYGDWDIVRGDVRFDHFDRKIHMIPRFNIPSCWPIYYAMDWGEAVPSVITWWARCDGSAATGPNNEAIWFPKDTRICIGELFLGVDDGTYQTGLRLTDPQIVERMKVHVKEDPQLARAKTGVGDTQLHKNYSDSLATPNSRYYAPAGFPMQEVKGKDRINGWAEMNGRFFHSKAHRLEEPGLFAFDHLRHFQHTFENAQRDPDRLDDILDPDDYADCCRYAITFRPDPGLRTERRKF